MKFCINVFQLKILHELLPSFSAIVLAVRWFGKVFKLMQTQQNYSVSGESSYNEILSESICNRCRFCMQNICQIYNMFGIENLILDWLRHKLSFEQVFSVMYFTEGFVESDLYWITHYVLWWQRIHSKRLN